jgi:hypothetical protein
VTHPLVTGFVTGPLTRAEGPIKVCRQHTLHAPLCLPSLKQPLALQSLQRSGELRSWSPRALLGLDLVPFLTMKLDLAEGAHSCLGGWKAQFQTA